MVEAVTGENKTKMEQVASQLVQVTELRSKMREQEEAHVNRQVSMAKKVEAKEHEIAQLRSHLRDYEKSLDQKDSLITSLQK